ncbi:MAG: serine hydrolase domain-containing protein [Bacteroidota bacterium]
MKLIPLLSLILFCLTAPIHATSQTTLPQAIQIPTSDEYAYVDTLVNALLHKTQVAGISVSVNQAGSLLYAKGFGYADIKQKKKMQATTQVRTASVAKVLTTTALGKLASEGQLDFDAPLKKYLPYLQAPYAQLTTRQIAGHTAGIQHRPSSKKIKKKHYAEIRPTVDFFKDDPLLFEPDTKYQYSTLGYNLLAALIESVSGKKYVDYMREDIFLPLNMLQTFPDSPSGFSEKDAKLYFFKKGNLKLDRFIQDGSYKLAGAGFRSTAVDLVQLMNAYTHGFISPEIVQEMFTSHSLKNGEATHVGLGWRLNRDFMDQATIEHAGSWQGARTVIVHYPKHQLSIAMMINTKCNLFIEETAHLLAQFFIPQTAKRSTFQQLHQKLEISSRQADGSTVSYTGDLHLANEQGGSLNISTEREWLKQNTIYPLFGQHFALATSYGLLYLQLKQQPHLEGKLFLYQKINDPYHMRKEAMLYFR